MKRRVVVGVAVAGAAVVLGALAWWLLSRPPGAEATAEAYLDALEAGDGERALSLVQAPSVGDAARLTAFAGADEYLSGARVERVQPGEEGVTTASVTFSLGGAEHSAALDLTETDGRWTVSADGLGVVSADATLGEVVLVGGAPVPSGTDVTVLPAVYPAEAAPTTLLDGAASVVVLPGERSEATIDASVSPEASTLAQEQLGAYAEQCAMPSAAVPEHCGMRVPWAADLATLDEITFRIEQMPQVALSADLESFDATGGVLVATATGMTRDGASASFTYRADDWALRGTIALSSDGMQLAVG